jgi:hypothetical protein
MFTISRALMTVAGLCVAGNAIADVPISIYRYGDFTLDIQVSVDGELVCDEDLVVSKVDFYANATVCEVDLSGAAELHLVGKIKSDDGTGSFDKTYPLIDFAQYSAVLRDPSLDFGERLDQHRDTLLAFDKSLTNWIRLDHPDISEASVEQALGPNVMAVMPSEMKAMITRDLTVSDTSYISPAFVHRPDTAPRWPRLTEAELNGGRPEQDLPKQGSELRDWYDRVLVLYEMLGDGVTTVVWDPKATAGDPAFFWLDEDTREVFPFVYADETPASALDVLLIPYEVNHVRYLTEDDPVWLIEAAKTLGVTELDPMSYYYLVDSSNPNAEISLSFAQKSTMPFFKTVEADIELYLNTWWRR